MISQLNWRSSFNRERTLVIFVNYFLATLFWHCHSLRLFTRSLISSTGPGLWLVKSDLVTYMLASDWSSLTSSRSPLSSLSASRFWRESMYLIASRMMSSCVTLSFADTLGISSFNLKLRENIKFLRVFRAGIVPINNQTNRKTNRQTYKCFYGCRSRII